MVFSVPRPKEYGSFSQWKEAREKALELWKHSRSQVKTLARVYNPDRNDIRIALEECDEFIRDYLYEPECMKGDYPDLFFDFEKDSHHEPTKREVPPDGGELGDPTINKARSFVPKDTFVDGGKILRPQ